MDPSCFREFVGHEILHSYMGGTPKIWVFFTPPQKKKHPFVHRVWNHEILSIHFGVPNVFGNTHMGNTIKALQGSLFKQPGFNGK